MSPDDSAETDLAQRFSDLARTLLAEDTVGATLDRMTTLAVAAVGPCELATITLAGDHRLTTPAGSSELAIHIDELQAEVGQGPCLDAMREHRVLVVDDLQSDARWPLFSAAAARLGVRSVMGFRLYVGEQTLGALNLYSSQPAAFHGDDTARQTASIFASHAAIALFTAQSQASLETALQTRDVIGQAKGILMARHGLTADQAFERLREASQVQNRTLRSIAAQIAYTGAD